MADPTGITDEEILKRFSVAVHEMLADEDLAKAMPQEFTITPDLAMKLQPVFPEWRVSAEWTSREDKHKRIAWNDEDGKLRSRLIRPDIIVHKAHTEINILVVEAKKATSKQKLDGDIEKLKLMTMQERLASGLSLRLPHWCAPYRRPVGTKNYRQRCVR